MTKIVCEIGINHGGSFGNAIEYIDTAVECGVDAVKFQYYIPEVLCFNRDNYDAYILLVRNKMNHMWLSPLKRHCELRGVELMCTTFCKCTASIANPYLKSFKVASPEAKNLDFLEYLSEFNKPVIISTGKVSDLDLDEIFRKTNMEIELLYCISKYPAEESDYDLSKIKELRQKYKCKVGLSDHTTTLEVSKKAIDMGVSSIERHFKLSDDCVDACVSIDSTQLKELCDYRRQQNG